MVPARTPASISPIRPGPSNRFDNAPQVESGSDNPPTPNTATAIRPAKAHRMIMSRFR